MVQRSTFRASLAVKTAKDTLKKRQRRRGPHRVAAALLIAAPAFAIFAAQPAAAQVTRVVPGTTERALADARERLIQNPGDVNALRDGVQAALRLGLLNLAASYAERAQQLSPGDGVITAARGAIEVHRARPREGLLLFAEADKIGVPEDVFSSDRALGYDLIGDQPSAQYYYALARRQSPDDETLRRYALSLAIIGDFETGEAMLRPLINVQDSASLRMHAFMLAISGRVAEARKVLEETVPPELAEQLAPYMDAMPRLSRAQQAAAANLGLFPSLASLGTPAPQPFAASTMPAATSRRRPDAGTARREAEDHDD